MRKLLIIAALLSVSPAFAQQQPDPETLQRAIQAVQLQRNQALDISANLQVQLSKVQEDLAKAQARLKELEPKAAEAK